MVHLESTHYPLETVVHMWQEVCIRIFIARVGASVLSTVAQQLVAILVLSQKVSTHPSDLPS